MSLTSIAAVVWNEIAETQKLKTAWARTAFALDGMEMAELEDKEWKELLKTVDSELASAAVEMKPLLLENEAISRFTQERPNYRQALPEIVSISEAVIVASMDYPLSDEQQVKLKDLLELIVAECMGEAKDDVAGLALQEWSPLPGALVTVLLDKNGKRKQTAMVVDVCSTNFILVELMGAGGEKGRVQLRYFPPERVLRRHADMLSIGSAVLFRRLGK